MKAILSIALILLTTIHALPISELINGHFISCVSDIHDENIEDTKKEKNKQPLVKSLLIEAIDNSDTIYTLHFNINKSQLMHLVESPPPDFI